MECRLQHGAGTRGAEILDKGHSPASWQLGPTDPAPLQQVLAGSCQEHTLLPGQTPAAMCILREYRIRNRIKKEPHGMDPLRLCKSLPYICASPVPLVQQHMLSLMDMQLRHPTAHLTQHLRSSFLTILAEQRHDCLPHTSGRAADLGRLE